MPSLHILSGGAANGLVDKLQAMFQPSTGLAISGTFSPVGRMKEALLAGPPFALGILTQGPIRVPGARWAPGGGRGCVVPQAVVVVGFKAFEIGEATDRQGRRCEPDQWQQAAGRSGLRPR